MKKETKKVKKNNNSKNETIDLDNEIIIGLRPQKQEPKKKTTKKITTKKTSTKKKKINKGTQKKKLVNKKKNNILKWTSLFIILLVVLALFLLSDLFNIKTIKVEQNNIISEEEIINLSGLQIDENMFKFLKGKIKDNIKTNPYIKEVQIKRNLDGTVTIQVEERVATFLLKTEDKYAYIDNQGYILEIVSKADKLTEITGFTAQNIVPGERLIVEDLEKLDTVIKIMEAAQNKNLEKSITTIDISDKTNYLITMKNEKKVIHFGDSSNINDKFLYIEALLKDTKNEEGEIFLNKKKVIFRKKVSVWKNI